jgi:hypothetical protein
MKKLQPTLTEQHRERLFNHRLWPGGGGLALVCAAGAALASPALSNAAQTIIVDRPCYVEGQGTQVTGSGFTPTGEVSLSFNVLQNNGQTKNLGFLVTRADGAGNISARVKTPRLASSDDTHETVFLAATDQTQAQQGPPPPVTTQWTISVFDTFVPPWESRKKKGNPRRKTTFYAWGFEGVEGQTLYAHYILHGKLRKTVAIGRFRGPCGDLKKRARQFPFRPVPAGDYKVELDATKRYPNKAPGISYSNVRVSRARAVH